LRQGVSPAPLYCKHQFVISEKKGKRMFGGFTGRDSADALAQVSEIEGER
jgi:hypothetical protein